VSCPISRKAPKLFVLLQRRNNCAVCCGNRGEITIDCPVRLLLSRAATATKTAIQRSLPRGHASSRRKDPAGYRLHPPATHGALAFSIAKFCAVQPAAVDTDVLALSSRLPNLQNAEHRHHLRKTADAPLPPNSMPHLSPLFPGTNGPRVPRRFIEFLRANSRNPRTPARRVPHHRAIS